MNPQEIHPERIKKCDKEHIKNLDYTNVTFPVTQKYYRKIEIMDNVNISVFGYEKQEPYPVYKSKEKFDDMLNLLLITKEKEQHYVLIKDFNKFMYNQTKHEEREHFCMYFLQCFPYEKTLINHKENCITINGAQAIKCLMLMIWYISKTTIRDWQLHSLFMLILRLLMKRYTDVNQIMIIIY